MNVFESVGSSVRRVALWSLCAGFACGAWAEDVPIAVAWPCRDNAITDPSFEDGAGMTLDSNLQCNLPTEEQEKGWYGVGSGWATKNGTYINYAPATGRFVGRMENDSAISNRFVAAFPGDYEISFKYVKAYNWYREQKLTAFVDGSELFPEWLPTNDGWLTKVTTNRLNAGSHVFSIIGKGSATKRTVFDDVSVKCLAPAADALLVAAEPQNYLIDAEPFYGAKNEIASGDEFTFTAPEGEVTLESGLKTRIIGWTIYRYCPADQEFKVESQSTEQTKYSCTYRHGDQAGVVVWRWATPSVEPTGVTRYWTGLGTDDLASNAANWTNALGEAGAPAVGDAIVLCGAADAESPANKAMTYDAAAPRCLASWAQSGYANVITIGTVYDADGFLQLHITGDVELDSGKWTHLPNMGLLKTYWLNVSVGGNFTLGADAAVDVSKRGYTRIYEENEPKISGFNVGGSYGGWGCSPKSGEGVVTAPYGRFYAPDLPGTAGKIEDSTGGGVFKLICAGKAILDGAVLSNGGHTGYAYYTGTGGSIWIICGEIEGEGTLSSCSDAGISGYPGSGGRIAVKLTKEGADFSKFDLVRRAKAYSEYTGAAPGSIYGETAADIPNEGWLIFKNRDAASSDPNKWSTPFTRNVTKAHVARLTFVNYQRVCIKEGQTLDLTGTVVERLSDSTTATSKDYGVYMTGGAIVVDEDEFAIDDYTITTTCGWAPDTANFIIRNTGRYILSGGTATCTGSLQLLTSGYAEINDDLALAGGVSLANPCTLKIAADKTLSVGGDWLYAGGTFTPAAGSTVEFAGDAVASVSGTTSFANLTCMAPGKEFIFADSARWNVSGTMNFEGADDDRLSLAAATEGATWTLDTSKGAAKMKNTNVSDCKSVSQLSISGGEGENNTNVSFVNITPGDTITWTGAAGTAWLAAGNWIAEHDGSRTPVATDNVVIPAEAPAWPALSEDVEVASFATAAGSKLSLNGFTLTVNGSANLAGDVTAADGGFTFGGDVAWAGASVGAGANVLLNNATAQVFAPTNAALGAVTVLTPALMVDGFFTGTTVTIGDGASAQVVSFAPGTTVACDDFLVNGDATTKNVRLKAAVDGAWLLQARESRVVGATVSDSDAREGWMIETVSCADAGNNQNWCFTDTRTHYAGGDWPALDADTDLVIDRGVTATLPGTVTALKSIFVMQGANLEIDVSLAVTESVRLGTATTVSWNQPSTIGGELRLEPTSLLTHEANGDTEDYRLDLQVGGNVIVSADARIDTSDKGFTSKTTLANHQFVNAAASHGGRGYVGGNADYTWPSYGSIFTPTNAGGTGTWGPVDYGGGIIHIRTPKGIVVDGTVSSSVSWASPYYTAAGGSVWLEAATLSGSGTIAANGGECQNSHAGSGGRISIVLSEQGALAPFDGTVTAYPGIRYGAGSGSEGTIYYSFAGNDRLILRNYRNVGTYYTQDDAVDVPSTVANADDLSRFANVEVEIGDHGTMNLMADLKIKNLIYDATARLKLNGHVLKIGAKRPKDWPKTGLPSWVDAGGTPENPGRVEWQTPGLMIILR